MSKRQSHALLTFIMGITLYLITPYTQAQQHTQKKIQKLYVAVMDFDAREGLTRGEAASLSDLFSSQLVATGEFVVVDRNRIKSILTEQGFQQSEACAQVECIVEAGKILKVQKMFAGTIGKIGKIFSVNIQMLDVVTSQVEVNKSYQHTGDVEELAEDVIPELAREIAEQVTGKRIEKAEVAKTSSYKWLWYVGGAVVLGGGVATYYYLKESENPPPVVDENLPGPPTLP